MYHMYFYRENPLIMTDSIIFGPSNILAYFDYPVKLLYVCFLLATLGVECLSFLGLKRLGSSGLFSLTLEILLSNCHILLSLSTIYPSNLIMNCFKLRYTSSECFWDWSGDLCSFSLSFSISLYYNNFSNCLTLFSNYSISSSTLFFSSRL